jgi:hypothetical protein
VVVDTLDNHGEVTGAAPENVDRIRFWRAGGQSERTAMDGETGDRVENRSWGDIDGHAPRLGLGDNGGERRGSLGGQKK